MANRSGMTDAAMMESLLRGFLAMDAATHKRRCAIRQGNREPVRCEGPCDWDVTRQWCRECGFTRREAIEENQCESD